MNIKARRIASGKTQLQFADAVNVGQSVVAMWESGKSSPRAEKLPEIAKALECTIDELYSDAIKAG